MRWSKVRKLVEESFAPSIRQRVAVHATRGRNQGGPTRCECGWGWITIDRRTLAVFDTHISRLQFGRYYHESTGSEFGGHPPITDAERTPGVLVEPGEFSRYDLNESCWQYLHSSIQESLASENPLVRSLAVLSYRVGKRRLRALANEPLHPLTRKLLEFRLEAEGIAPSLSPALSPAT